MKKFPRMRSECMRSWNKMILTFLKKFLKEKFYKQKIYSKSRNKGNKVEEIEVK